MPIAGLQSSPSRGRLARGSPRSRRSPRPPAGPTAAGTSSTCGKRPRRPSAKAALNRIAEFYVIEDQAGFAPPAERLAQRAPLITLHDDFFAWHRLPNEGFLPDRTSPRLYGYIIKRRAALTRFASDAGLEPDSNIAENAIRIALGRRNWAFAVSHSGCKRAAAIVLDPGDRKK